MPTTASGYLTADAAACELGLTADDNDLQVARLAATRRIASARIPSGTIAKIADLRISGEAIAAFIKAGSPGLPASYYVDSVTGWIARDVNLAAQAAGFEDAIRAALQQSAPTQPQLKAQAKDADLVEVAVAATAPAVAAVLAKAPPASWMPNIPRSTFVKWADVWAAVETRNSIAWAMQRTISTDNRPAFERLVSSVESYDAAVASAHADLSKRAISTTAFVRVFDARGLWRDVPCRLALSVASFLPNPRALGLLAF